MEKKITRPLAGKLTAWVFQLAWVLLLTLPMAAHASEVVERDLGGQNPGAASQNSQTLAPLPGANEETSGSALDSVVSDSNDATTASAASEAKGEFTEGFKGVGRGFKSGTHATGKAFKKVGVTMGHGFQKAGSAMAKGFKKVGSSIKGIFVREKSSEPSENRDFLAEGQAAQGVEQEYQDTEAAPEAFDDNGEADEIQDSAPPQESNDWARANKDWKNEVNS